MVATLPVFLYTHHGGIRHLFTKKICLVYTHRIYIHIINNVGSTILVLMTNDSVYTMKLNISHMVIAYADQY